MFKKFRITLERTDISYTDNETLVNCTFKMTDPSSSSESIEGEIFEAHLGTYRTSVSFEAGYEPTKPEIVDEVSLQEGMSDIY